MSCDTFLDFVDGRCGRINTACVDGVVVVTDVTFACSLPDAGGDTGGSAELDAPTLDAPADPLCADEGTVVCGSPARVCCDGMIREFFDGPCMPTPDAGMPTEPDCASSPVAPGCPCAVEGAEACRGGMGIFMWSTICRDGRYVEQANRVCCS